MEHPSSSQDRDVFLLCFAQLQYALSIAPTNEDYLSARAQVIDRLEHELRITLPQLLARSIDTYTVSYRERDEVKLLEFPAEEIEDFVP